MTLNLDSCSFLCSPVLFTDLIALLCCCSLALRAMILLSYNTLSRIVVREYIRSRLENSSVRPHSAVYCCTNNEEYHTSPVQGEQPQL